MLAKTVLELVEAMIDKMAEPPDEPIFHKSTRHMERRKKKAPRDSIPDGRRQKW